MCEENGKESEYRTIRGIFGKAEGETEDMVSENKKTIANFLKELDRDRTAVDAFFSPACSAHLPGSPLPVDREGFKEFVNTLYIAFPDLHHHVLHQIAEGDMVASLVAAEGTHEGDFQGIGATRRLVTITDMIIARIEVGRVAELWAQFDALGLLAQLQS